MLRREIRSRTSFAICCTATSKRDKPLKPQGSPQKVVGVGAAGFRQDLDKVQTSQRGLALLNETRGGAPEKG